MIYLGFDTSNYTTSAAAVGDGFLKNERKILAVPKGMRGIRQSDAVFSHMKTLPILYERLADSIRMPDVAAVGVSTRPRRVEGSYMPVFLAGMGYASVIAKTLGVPLFEFSHQDGHIMAGILNSPELLNRDFLSVHLSGGTTEILKSRYDGNGFENEIIGGTKDISAGQLIDRVGVQLGLEFPCGKALEDLAAHAKGTFSQKISVSDCYVNFSGAETAFMRNSETIPPEELAYAALMHVADALCRMLNNAIKKTGTDDILIVGGVASDAIIKEHLRKNVRGTLYFASAELSSDNAVGIAALAERKMR